MPRDGSGVYSAPAGTLATPNTTILSANYNAFVNDLVTDANAARPTTAGGTGGTSVITGWDGLAKKGTDIATAASINLTTATGPSITLTGTTTITSATLAEGSFRLVRAASAFQITASASLLCNGSSSSNMSVAAEDLLLFRGGASNVVSVVKLASGAAATTSSAGIVELATAAEALAGTDTTRAVTPSGLYFPTGHLYGLTLSNNASDATNDIDIAAGTARDGSDTVNMLLASALTKRLDAAWAVGTGNGGLDTGSVANTTYYIWLIKRSDTGVVDALLSTSSTAPTMPTNYDYKRLIGYVVRASAANGIPVNTDRKPGVEYAGVAPVFACRAWLTFQGDGTVTVNASGNVSSVTDNGAGDYTVNFTTALPHANYAVVGIANANGVANAQSVVNIHASSITGAPTTKTTSACRIAVGAASNGTLQDARTICVIFIG